MGSLSNVKTTPLNRNFLFRRVYKRGQSFAGSLVVAYVLARRGGEIRLGISASKKIGGAVQRNRARRIVKEAARLTLGGARRGGFDIVLVCRGAAVRAKSTDVLKELGPMLKKAGVVE